MRFSVVDLGVVAPGTDEKQALTDSLAFARQVEGLGFKRIWFAEHHAAPMGASHHPELLIAAAGAVTSSIRVGSGSVLMNHYSPFKVAEMFKQLEAMFPGRVDLGMGRASGGPVVDMALQRDRSNPAQADHTQQIAETLAWLTEGFPDDHPFATVQLLPSVEEVPHTWLLGSSPQGSNLAAGLGLGYVFAGFINPRSAASALQNYREQFQPGLSGMARPRAILAVNVSVGETAADADRLVSSPKGFYARLARGNLRALAPSTDEAAQELTRDEQDEPTTITDGRWPRFVAGDPSRMRATLEQMAAESGADEIMVQNMIADPDDRFRSHERLAGVFDLEAPPG